MKNGAVQIGLEDLAPGLDRHAHDQVVAGDARVVDQDVDLAERLEDGLDDRVRGLACDASPWTASALRPRASMARVVSAARRRCPCR
jgi:hypothetical protein